MTSEHDLQWAVAYERLLPLFSAVLRQLASRRVLVRSSQGLEIIHDFFVEEWAKVARDFNPDRGTLEAFATYAFVRFARRRIAKEAHLDRILAPEALTEGLVGDGEPHGFSEVDHQRVRQALTRLAPTERSLLELRFSSTPATERELAMRFGLTRYGVRQLLVSGLTKLIAVIGDNRSLGPTDRMIAKAFFIDAESTADVAMTMGISESQALRARARILSTISRLLRGRQ